ncbi:MAG: Cof-type HAD-IIB family hydrolase [Tissierellia bacterium]|nr:Cof-type HAD-IIB family hydrolase [Tissierellia bacterium]
MKKFKMIATDLDETLLNKKKQISKNNIQALRDATKTGSIVVLASGRVMKSIESYKKAIDIEAPIISCNGAYVKNLNGDIILDRQIPFETIKEIARIGDKYGVYYHFYNSENIYSKFKDDKYKKYYFTSGYDNEKVNIKIQYDDIEEIKEKNIPIYKTLFISLDIELRDKVEEELKNIPNTTVTSSIRNNIEVTAKGVDKGAALKKLAQIYNIENKDIIAIGDNRNDIPMIEYAGLGIAVRNSAKNLKDKAKLVVCSNEEDAVAKVIKKYILKEEF